MVALKGTNYNKIAILGNIYGVMTFWNYNSNEDEIILENNRSHIINEIIQLNKTEYIVSANS